MIKKLTEISKKKTVIVDSVQSTDRAVVDELEILGFIPGTKATVVAESIFSGPVTLLLRGAKVAIRKFEADCIAVTA